MSAEDEEDGPSPGEPPSATDAAALAAWKKVVADLKHGAAALPDTNAGTKP